jgi:autotransporter adhesin
VAARADDCLLDTNNDGNADADVDTDLGADSAGVDTRLACGFQASATGPSSIALGTGANAAGSGSIALGSAASASANNTTAIGTGASAIAPNSVALGTGAFANAPSTVSVGFVGGERRVVNVAAGTGATDAVNLNQLSAVQASVTAETVARTAADLVIGDAVTGLGARVDSLTGRVEGLQDYAAASTAVAVAMGGVTFLPDMHFNLSANVATYDGAHAGSIQIGALVSPHVALNAGIATGFNKKGQTAARVGFAVGW